MILVIYEARSVLTVLLFCPYSPVLTVFLVGWCGREGMKSRRFQ